jgi:hypothetical protein
MSRTIKSSKSNPARGLPEPPKLPPTDARARAAKLLSACVEILELCIEVTGTIDPAAAWLVAHAKDEVTLGVYGARDSRPY